MSDPENIASIDYFELAQALTNDAVDASAAECHGCLVGLYCAGLPQDKLSWQAPLIGAINQDHPLSTESMQIVQRVQQILLDQLASMLGFTPLLPDDDAPMEARLRALASWCEGWLLGFGSGGVDEKTLGADSLEVLGDIGEIAQMETLVGDDDDAESMERSFWEVVEHLRIAVEFVMSEQLQNPASSLQSTSLH